ncbi:MAG: class II aldolase/adducin family protein [Syntrophomonadaceae bacterium]|jgi:L-ribulose-5-phosphate 4-epimerase
MRYLKEREGVLNCAREIYESGMVTGTWGNVSSRIKGQELFIITPSGMNYSLLQPQDMVLLDLAGKVIAGQYRPSVETPLHLSIYQHRSDINAVVHVHSPYATAFAVARKSIPVILEETAQVVGHEIGVADYAPCGTQVLADNVLNTLGTDNKAVLLANHGLVALGQDIAEALKICYIIEETAMIFIQANTLGMVYSLAAEDIAFLHKSFKSYGQEKK